MCHRHDLTTHVVVDAGHGVGVDETVSHPQPSSDTVVYLA
jgi:hypothetical protein